MDLLTGFAAGFLILLSLAPLALFTALTIHPHNFRGAHPQHSQGRPGTPLPPQHPTKGKNNA